MFNKVFRTWEIEFWFARAIPLPTTRPNVYLLPKGYASLDVGMMGVGQCPVTALDSNKLEEEAEVEKDSIEEISGMITNSFFFQFVD